ncbi:MAG: hypothetical protein KME26_22110 [Oscillatoria princeps RMCB-10]|nr:hypothetical protein [Oscillatoria princeps RMCB-10]
MGVKASGSPATHSQSKLRSNLSASQGKRAAPTGLANRARGDGPKIRPRSIGWPVECSVGYRRALESQQVCELAKSYNIVEDGCEVTDWGRCPGAGLGRQIVMVPLLKRRMAG